VKIADFRLERFLSRWEFQAPYLLCSSDVEGMRMGELLQLADEPLRARFSDCKLGYTEAPGLPELRAEIARLYRTVAPDEIYTFAGAEEAIFAFYHVVVEPGDQVVVTWPAYQSLCELPRALGAQVSQLALSPDDGWAVRVEALPPLLGRPTRVVAFNFPHNPTGALPDRATFEALVGEAEAAGARVFSDEVYRLLEYDDADRLPAAVDLSPTAVSLGVMSKAFGLAGLRIGWVATHDAELRSRLAAFKDYTSICNSAPSELLALIALKAKERVLARSRAIVAANLQRLDDFFARHAERVRFIRPRAGSVAFPKWLGTLEVDALAESLAREVGVLLLPGTVYDHPGNHFRIGLGRTDLADGLAAFERYLLRS
jgi:aspartate/methionine/tyrosine aminotransferase